MSAICMPQFHTQLKKAYQLVSGCYFTSQLLPVQLEELQHQCVVRFTHAQTAALEMLQFTEQKSYQHKLTKEGSRSGKIVSFLVVITFQLATRFPVYISELWVGELSRKNKTLPHLRSLEAWWSHIEQAGRNQMGMPSFAYFPTAIWSYC